MKHAADYEVVLVTNETIFIKDLDRGGRSVTNDAEAVVERLLETYGKTRDIVYRDSQGQWDCLLHDGNEFVGFAPFRGDLPKVLR